MTVFCCIRSHLTEVRLIAVVLIPAPDFDLKRNASHPEIAKHEGDDGSDHQPSEQRVQQL